MTANVPIVNNSPEMADSNILTCDTLEDQNGKWAVYFTLADGRAESYFTEPELKKMLSDIEDLQ